MSLLGKHNGWLHMVVGFMGVSHVKATTDTPGAKIALSYRRRGVEHHSNFTLQELLSGITQDSAEQQTPVPGEFTDIADIP